MGTGCGGGRGPGERGARAARGGGRARDAAPGVRTRPRRELAAAARPGPPRRILGGVERPKRRRRDRNRGGDKSQLPGAKAPAEGSRGAARRRGCRWEAARGRGRAGTRRPADAHLFGRSRLALARLAGSDPRRPAPPSAERSAPQGQLRRSRSPTPPSPHLPSLPSPRAPAPHLCWDRASCRGPRTRRSCPPPPFPSQTPLHCP